ncbi:MAG: hypothetical protein BWY09_00045 [Candidatus Hydrogenedentes bacterium ADurb.Bin179]|nr:MAG: hypothetical protein BWY09_00045 [Candidatus Hydrogenedentes bacterium ADurb.Bin179]
MLVICRRAKPGRAVFRRFHNKFIAGRAQFRLNGLGNRAGMAQILIAFEQGHQSLVHGHAADIVRIDAHEGQAHVVPQGLAQQVFNVIGISGLRPGRWGAVLPVLYGPPAEIHGQVHVGAFVVRRTMHVNEPFVGAGGMVPGPHARAHAPQVVVKGAHLKQGGPVEPVGDFVHEFGTVMPAVFPTTQNVFAVEGVQVNHVETAFVEGVRCVGRHFRQERGVGVRRKQAEAFLQFIGRRPRRVGGRLGAVGAAFTFRKRERRFLRRSREYNQLVVYLERDAVSREETGYQGDLRGGFIHRKDRCGLVHRRGQGECGVLAQARVGYRCHVWRVLGDEKSVGVQPGGNTRRVQFVRHRLHAGPPVREQHRVGRTVAEAQRRTRVKVDLVEAQPVHQVNPLVHSGFRQGTKIEEVGAAVARCVQGPGSANGRLGGILVLRQARRRGDGVFQAFAQ